jgi:uncharacterized protein
MPSIIYFTKESPLLMNRRIPFLTLLFCTFFLALPAQEVPPPSNTLVTDYIGLLQPQERAALERKLVAYNDSTSTQIAIVIDGPLNGKDLFDYSLRIAEAWGIGGAEFDNGVLIYIPFEDRKVIIQTGYGVEGFLPDAMARRIIENVIAPAFRQERYYAGLDRATDVIIQLGSGEYVNEGGEEAEGIPFLAVILILLIIAVVLFSLFGGDDDDGGYYGGGRYDMDRRGMSRRRGGGWIILPGGGGGGWGGGGGGFGGGGFGGFGGGGFGGGGASGGW